MTMAPTLKATIAAQGDREIRIERVFNSKRERVWRAFTDPEQLVKWWAPTDKAMTVVHGDVRRGGRWRYELTPADAAKSNEGFEGKYREVTAPERLVYSFEWDGMPGHVFIETTEFEDLGDGRTRVVSTMLCHTNGEREGMMHSGMEHGVNQQYAALDRLLAEG
jgi:uncharacterized protein YndB with AHSA1/START domain